MANIVVISIRKTAKPQDFSDRAILLAWQFLTKGICLLMAFLVFDSFTSNFQEKLFKEVAGFDRLGGDGGDWFQGPKSHGG